MSRVKKGSVLAILGAALLAVVAACGSADDSTTGPSSTDPKDKYVGGKWITKDIEGSGDGWDVVFKSDNTFDGYLPGGTTVKIKGPYSVDSAGNVTGSFTATSGGRVGNIEAHLESNDTVLYFDFIETNAYDNPHAVNGVVHLRCRGTNPTKPASGSGSGSTGGSSSTSDAIPAKDIVWDGDRDPSGWKVIDTGFKITEVRGDVPAPTVCWSWTLPSGWPVKDGKSVGNNWIIAKVNGVWHATPWEHLPPASAICRTTEARSGQPPFVQGMGPIASSWYPTSGEQVGFVNTTIARGARAAGTPDERTNIVVVKWP